MMDYEHYKTKLENQFNQSLKDILFDCYVTKDLGPSVGAKQLGIPREVFIHYRNEYKLKELKHIKTTQQPK